MIRVFYDANAIFIDNIRVPMVAGTLTANASGNTVTITSIHSTQTVVANDYSMIADIDGNGFDNVADAVAYLNEQFALPTVTGTWQDVLNVVTQNVIPPLSKPWVSAPGSLANIIIGAATLTNGAGAVVFQNGSTSVSFNPQAAGFNLNPDELVIAQYSYKG